MGDFSNTANDLLLNYMFRTDQTVTRPTTVYLGLATASIDRGDGLADVTEPTDTAYARILVYDDDGTPAYFGAPADDSGVRTIENNTAITFGPFDTGGQEITHFFLCTSSDNTGDILAAAALPESKTPSAGDELEFASGTLKVGNS